jgi:hypothetical protein
MQTITLDVTFYRERHPDLVRMTDQQLVRHFEVHGEREGRVCAAYAIRDAIAELALAHRSVLEIGPFFRPALRGPNVRYFDVLDRPALVSRAESIGRPTDTIPEIDFVSPTGDLRVVDQAFDAAFSAHCLEHQPDLVSHLKQVAALLPDGGRYYLIIPDKRYCFDHYLPVTSVADVLDAHERELEVHSLKSIVNGRSMTTHNHCVEHWKGRHDDTARPVGHPDRVKRALAEYRASDGRYIDVPDYPGRSGSRHKS